MTIKQQVDDSVLLYEHGRYQGCLSMLLLAVGASSRKVLPYPEHKDFYSFPMFLGSRLSNELFRTRVPEGSCKSGIAVEFKGKEYWLEDVLYKFYRNALVHEGKLPDDVVFEPGHGMPAIQGEPYLKIPSGSKLVLDSDWLNVLARCVVNARCNRYDFGIVHYDEVPLDNLDMDEIAVAVARKMITTKSRVNMMMSVFLDNLTTFVSNPCDKDICEAFDKSLYRRLLNQGAISGLQTVGFGPENAEVIAASKEPWNFARRGFVSTDSKLTELGIQLLREISSKFDIVKVV